MKLFLVYFVIINISQLVPWPRNLIIMHNFENGKFKKSKYYQGAPEERKILNGLIKNLEKGK